ncbi:hypothetical protein SD71_06995 [Cohnella kolymensis]|uniref:Pyrrolo-quinoline quinone repeat domain-containing protein n=1 Tax=Cohnella kolymensis TaxID=1590652 RepID=A0ABR5A8J2_9BACL|nr:PQQ-binding-like beta-propeller repeat protein [Cohnella kolymensis]KIL36732.1 hypothetical protein SD71_06995 [Cohnella kolymensis]
MSAKQLDVIFGPVTDVKETYISINNMAHKVKLELYGTPDAQLMVYWSGEGRLLHAVFYDNDAVGERRSYLPALGGMQASSSGNNRVARNNGIALDQPATLYADASGYEWWGGERPIAATLVKSSLKYRVITLSDDFAELEEETGYRYWVPVWYLTKAASDIQEISPLVMQASGELPVSWYPESEGHAMLLKRGSVLYAYRRYGDWYGVAAPDRDNPDRQPGLLWVRKDQLVSMGKAPAWYSDVKSKEAASEVLSAVVRSELLPFVPQKRVREILGEPNFVEASENVAQYDQKARTLPVWRYENAKTQLVISWSEDGKLSNYQFRDVAGFSSFGLTGVPGPFVPSQPVDWDWRYRSDLAYNFLIDRIGNVLLVAGEDGGFSGMHENSNLYALDSDTGRKIWQFDFGHEAHFYGLSSDRKNIMFLKRSVKDGEEFYKLQSLQISTGTTVWEKTLRFKPGVLWNISLAVSDDIAAVLSQFTMDSEQKGQSFLEGWNMKTGKHLWKVKLPDSSEVSYTSIANQPVVLVQSNSDSANDGELRGYSPSSGKMLWTLHGRRLAGERELVDAQQSTQKWRGFWTRTTDKLIFVDAANGHDRLTLDLPADTRYSVIDDRYVFKNQETDNGPFPDDVELNSSLVDLQTGQSVWTVSGKAEYGERMDGVLFYTLDGKPMAYDLNNGRQLWDSDLVTAGPSVTYNGKRINASINTNIQSTDANGVYVMDSRNGQAEGRLLDVRVGYYDFTPEQLMAGYLRVIKGKLYVGSSNGYFGRLSKLR